MADAKIAKYKSKLEVISGQIERIADFVKTELKLAGEFEIELRLSSLEKYFENFESNQTSLEELDPNEITGDSRAKFEERYHKLKPALLVEINRIKKETRINLKAEVNDENLTNIDLPKIKLPLFSGEFMNWIPFFETFKTLVHNNKRLDDIQKFHHLRSSLTGAAFNRIKSLEITSTNYLAAFKLLTDRYDNKRLVAQDHIRALFNLPTMDKGSSVKLRELIDSLNNHLNSLNGLGRPTTHWDDLIVYIVLQKLDTHTRIKWEDECPHDRLARLDELLNFLDKRSNTLEGMSLLKEQTQPTAVTQNSKAYHNQKQIRQKISTSSLVSSTIDDIPNTSLISTKDKSCSYCAMSKHNIYRCRRFINLSIPDRKQAVSRLRLCSNCLFDDSHTADSCIRSGCHDCSAKHHTYLHQFPTSNFNQNHVNDSTARSELPNKSLISQPSTSTICHTMVDSIHTNEVASQHKSQCEVILATAIIHVQDKYGLPVACRALLDSGSQLHLVTERFAHKLGVKRFSILNSIAGIGNCKVNAKERTILTISSRLSQFSTKIEALILPKITGYQPSRFIDIQSWNLPQNIELADPKFNCPQKIDILIGAELYCSLLSEGQIQLSDYMPVLQNTIFGWIATGRTMLQQPILHCNMISTVTSPTLEQLFQQFCDLERHDSPLNQYTFEEQECETYFQNTVSRDVTGRYIVRLPFRAEPVKLGNSKNIAIKRFHHLERKLERDQALRTAYNEFMAEYEALGHMQPIELNDLQYPHYFLPHHCVHKFDSSSTKLRVVFDGSSKTTSKTSLNDILMVGPTIQPDLFSIITNFRTHKYVFTADISKMYRQITLHKSDRKFQCIFWRDSPLKELKAYSLNTVTYGTSSAPYLAIRCLAQLAEDDGTPYPLGAKSIKESFYVDDVMTGSNTIEGCVKMRDELILLLKKGGFELRKFCSNHPDILESIPMNHREVHLNILDNEVIKALGLIWQPTNDYFHFHVTPSEHEVLTRRAILSDLAKIFDPLGLIGPVVIIGKIFIQQLWKLKTNWDETLPIEYQSRWVKFRQQLCDLNNLQISRNILPFESIEKIQLHAFSDSSEAAYGTSIYIRSVDNSGDINVSLVCAKSRVAPLKVTSLPRLELCGALLMAELVRRVSSIIQCHPNNVFYWTDSTIVLSWISAPSYTWTTFVANRVAKIQDITNGSQWKHVPTSENPADIISRGMMPNELCKTVEWFHGPSYLQKSEQYWPSNANMNTMGSDLPEHRNQKFVLLVPPTSSSFVDEINHGHSVTKLQRIFAYCLRFISNCSKCKLSKIKGPLTADELDESLLILVKNIQSINFSDEIMELQKNQEVHRTSRLRSLSPFLDSRGLLRVGGRIQNSMLPFDSKHQLLLPKSSPFTTILMFYLHVKHLHAAPQALLAICRQRFWPIDGKIVARRTVNKCIRCFRTKPRSIEHLMGRLPTERVVPARPFYTTGIDFCGPVRIHHRIRGKAPTKAYIAIFICFTTRAVHLEIVTDLTSQAFIASLKRFIGRRGLCHTIFCDNATNFVGARSELRELKNVFQSQTHHDNLQKWCQEDRIRWKPIPPKSPHFGGLWEAAVKAAKHHLIRVTGNSLLTFEELNTLVIQIEAVLNSRPLTPISSDPNDLEALTPGHFLVGGPLTAIIEPDVTDVKVALSARYAHLRKLHQQFWHRWSSEYLNLLQQRHKWSTKKHDLSIDQFVLLKDENLPPLKWSLGRIIKLYPGKDGVVRVADIKTQFGVYKRAVAKLCPLPDESTF